MYNHQLHYDGQLAMFLMDAETALRDMWGIVWDAIHTLAESEGIMFNACLGLALQVLNLLPQIPTDILFHMQIPLTITYCPESSIYRKWHPKQGGILPLHKEIRASHTLSKVLGRVTLQPSESAGQPPSPTPLDHSVGPGGSQGSGHRACSWALSVTPACSQHVADDQALGAPWVVTTPSTPESLKMAMSLAVSLTPPKVRKVMLKKRKMPKWARVRPRPRVMNKKHQMVKTSRSTHTPRTPPPVLVSSSGA